MMKKFSKLFGAAVIAALSLGLAAACSDDDEDEIVEDEQQSVNYSLMVGYADVDVDNIPAAGTTMTLEITSNVAWTVSSSSDWIACGTTSGSNDGNVTLTIAENTSTESRTATVTVTGDPGLSDTVTITQLGAEEHYLTVAPATISDIAAAGSTETITISSNVDWTISSDSDWVTLSATSGTGVAEVTLTIAENASTDAREAIITVSGDGVSSVAVTASQLGAEETVEPYLTVESDGTLDYAVSAAGLTTTLTISSNVAWSIGGNSDWVTFDPMSGEGDATVTVTVAENTGSGRTASHYISGEGVNSVSLIIIQDAASTSSGAYFSLVDDTVTVPIEGSSYVEDDYYGDYYEVEFSVKVNSSSVVPTITCDNDAFTIIGYDDNPIAGYGEYYCYYGVTAAENTTGADITGTLTITYGDQTEYMTIVQEGPETSAVLYIDAGQYFRSETTFSSEADGAAWEMLYAKDSDGSQIASAYADFGVDGTYSLLKYEKRSSISSEYTFKMSEGAKIKFYTNPDAANKVVFKKIEFVVRSSEISGCYISADKGSCYFNDDYEEISSRMSYFQTWEAADSNTTEVTITATETYNYYYAFRFTFDVLDSAGNVIDIATYTTGF